MIGRMGRRKAGTLWPIANQHMDPGSVFGVIAGTKPPDILFDKGTAHKIGEDHGTGGKGDPPPARSFIIDGRKEDQKKIQGEPYIGITQPGH